MTIASVNSASASATAAAQAPQRTPEAAEVQKNGRDQDGDRDDSGTTVQSAPSPTVNLQGQKLGQVVNTLA